MSLFSRTMFATRRRREPTGAIGSAKADAEDQLVIAEQIAADVRSSLTAHFVAKLAIVEQRLEETVRPEPLDQPALEKLVEEAVAKEFEAATERIASMLLVHRRQVDAVVAREIESVREELGPKLVVRRTERPSKDRTPSDRA